MDEGPFPESSLENTSEYKFILFNSKILDEEV